MTQIENIFKNKWIRCCKDVWGSMIALAAKPRQEHVINIDEFI